MGTFFKKMLAQIKNTILAGLFLLLPITFTVFILTFLFSKLDGLLSPFATKLLILTGLNFPEGYRIPGIGVVAGLIVLFFVGVLTRIYIGKKFVALSEVILKKIPFVRSLYGSAKHVIEAVTKSDKNSFRRVVLVEYPRRGCYGIAFVTCETGGEVQLVTNEKVLSVFIPTTPNPTSGFLLFLPEKDVTPLAMSVDEGLKLVVSAGIVSPIATVEELKKIRLERGFS